MTDRDRHASALWELEAARARLVELNQRLATAQRVCTEAVDEVHALRQLLFTQHGHGNNGAWLAYGEHAEMQCGACGVDFRLDTPEQMASKVREYDLRRLFGEREGK